MLLYALLDTPVPIWALKPSNIGPGQCKNKRLLWVSGSVFTTTMWQEDTAESRAPQLVVSCRESLNLSVSLQKIVALRSKMFKAMNKCVIWNGVLPDGGQGVDLGKEVVALAVDSKLVFRWTRLKHGEKILFEANLWGSLSLIIRLSNFLNQIYSCEHWLDLIRLHWITLSIIYLEIAKHTTEVPTSLFQQHSRALELVSFSLRQAEADGTMPSL